MPALAPITLKKLRLDWLIVIIPYISFENILPLRQN
jgi:hypothetical protein